MTPEERAALREAASKAYDSDTGNMFHTWFTPNGTMQGIVATREGTAAVLALIDECANAKADASAAIAAKHAIMDQRDKLLAENERMRKALREIDRLGTLVAHDLQGRVEAGKVMAVQRMADNARAALGDGA